MSGFVFNTETWEELQKRLQVDGQIRDNGIGRTIQKLARAEYDFARDGGEIGAVQLGVKLPSNSIVKRAYYDVIETLTSATDAAVVCIQTAAGLKLTPEGAISATAFPYLAIQYTGEALSAELTITATHLTTSCALTPADDLNLAFATYATLESLIAAIEATGVYAVTLLGDAQDASADLNAVAGQDILTAEYTALADLAGNIWDEGLHDGYQVGSMSEANKIGIESEIEVSIATEVLTAGRIVVFVEYVVSD